MRKILAIVLLMVLGLPSALPLFAAGQDDAGVPACCRRHGKHHCMMQALDSDGAAAKRVAASAERDAPEMRSSRGVCPYRCELPPRANAVHAAAPAARLRLYAAVVSHPAQQAQTESRWRVARERARGKRGPPTAIGSAA